MTNEFSSFVRCLPRHRVDVLRHGAIGGHVGAGRAHRTTRADADRTDPDANAQTRAQRRRARFAIERLVHFASALAHELTGSFAFKNFVTDHAALDHAALERRGGMEVGTDRSGFARFLAAPSDRAACDKPECLRRARRSGKAEGSGNDAGEIEAVTLM